jgi:DNA-binding LacI/PurR family transcriptional regulator
MGSNDERRLPRLEDVAVRSKVSHQTVSRVINKHPNVSKATRERVEAAIAELGYRRNTAARSLVTRRTQTIGVLASELGQYGPANTLLGVQQAAREAGYFVSIAAIKGAGAAWRNASGAGRTEFGHAGGPCRGSRGGAPERGDG